MARIGLDQQTLLLLHDDWLTMSIIMMQGTEFIQLNRIQLPWAVSQNNFYSDIQLHVTWRNEGKRNIDVITRLSKFIRGCKFHV